MQKLQIPKNRMNYLIKQIQLQIDIATLETGWELYHKGRLMEIRLEEMTVHANIKGGGNFDVSLNLENFLRSSCSCNLDKPCGHLVAVCFILYTPYGRPELLLQQLKQVMYVRNKTLNIHEKEIPRKMNQPLHIEREMLPADWQRFFESKYQGYSISHQQSIDMFYQSVTSSLPTYAKTWPSSLIQIYELHITFFVLRKVEQFYIESKNSYLSFYHENSCKQCVKDCMISLHRLCDTIYDDTFLNWPEYWQATLSWIGDVGLLGKVSPVDWLSIYRLLWWKVNQHSSWVKDEIQRIEMHLDKKDYTPAKKDLWTIARAHFDVLLGHNDIAFQRLKNLHSLQPTDFYFYLHSNASKQAWSELLTWLRWLLPTVNKTTNEDFRIYCQFWLDMTSHLTSDQEWVDVMNSLLPRSYYFYTAYLLKTKRYAAWVDLQLSNRISPLSLYAVELSAIEQIDCNLLLPLYHQATERAILEKNRNSYKIAMRLLTQLREYYIQLEQNDRWETYIYKLSDKFSRLRSFQDELKRGNWIR